MVTLTIDGTLQDAAAALGRDAVIVAFAADDANKRVRGHFVEQPVSRVLAAIASQIAKEGVASPRPGGVWFVGAPTEADHEGVVFDVVSGLASDWSQAYAAVANEGAAVQAVFDRLVVRDSGSGIERMKMLHAALQKPRNQYLVDVTFVELSESAAKDMGIDWSLSAGIDARYASPGLNRQLVEVAAEVIAMFVASRDENSARIVSSSRLHVREGAEETLQVGDTIPIPRRAITEGGAIETLAFDNVDTGVLLRVSARNAGNGDVLLTVAPEISSVSRFIGEAPVISRRRLTSSVRMSSGGIVVLGGLSDQSETWATGGIPGWNVGNRETTRKERRRLFLFMRVTLVE